MNAKLSLDKAPVFEQIFRNFCNIPSVSAGGNKKVVLIGSWSSVTKSHPLTKIEVLLELSKVNHHLSYLQSEKENWNKLIIKP